MTTKTDDWVDNISRNNSSNNIRFGSGKRRELGEPSLKRPIEGHLHSYCIDDDSGGGRVKRIGEEYGECAESDPKTDWRSVYIVTLVSFVGAIHQNCINVWPYLQLMDPTASEGFYGLMRSISGIGSVCSALASGYACNLLHNTKWPMIFGKGLAIVSCMLYLHIETLNAEGGYRKIAFLIFEFFLGISAGAANVYRVHIAHNSTERDRPKAVGICSLAPAFGLLVGTLMQLCFTVLTYPGIAFLFGTHLNLFTAPMLLTIGICTVGILLLACCFDGRMHVRTGANEIVIKDCCVRSECPLEFEPDFCAPDDVELEADEHQEVAAGTTKALNVSSGAISSASSSEESTAKSDAALTASTKKPTFPDVPVVEGEVVTGGGSDDDGVVVIRVSKFDWTAAILCMATRAIINLSLLGFTTIGSPYMMTVFQWSSEETVKYQSILLGLIGIHIILWNFAYIFFDFRSKLSERKAIVISVFVVLSCYLLTYPWSFLSHTIAYRSDDPLNMTGAAQQPRGCSHDFAWCAWTPAVNMYVFLPSIVVTLGFGIPLSMINLEILFSKVLGCGVMQGTMQGVFTVSGDGLNIIAPIIISQVYVHSGPVRIWQAVVVAFLLCLFTWYWFYPRMISNTRRMEDTRQRYINNAAASSVAKTRQKSATLPAAI